jgi:hypothetical protein
MIRVVAVLGVVAFERGRRAGRQQGRAEAVDFLYQQAAAHQGQVGDQRRRGALRHAADRLRDGHGVGRP